MFLACLEPFLGNCYFAKQECSCAIYEIIYTEKFTIYRQRGPPHKYMFCFQVYYYRQVLQFWFLLLIIIQFLQSIEPRHPKFDVGFQYIVLVVHNFFENADSFTHNFNLKSMFGHRKILEIGKSKFRILRLGNIITEDTK